MIAPVVNLDVESCRILLAKEKKEAQAHTSQSDNDSKSGESSADSVQLVQRYVAQQVQKVLRMQTMYFRALNGDTSEGPSDTMDDSAPGTSDDCRDDDANLLSLLQASTTSPNWLPLFCINRRKIYIAQSLRLNNTAGVHSLYQLMHWCDERNIFLHPSIRIDRDPTAFRDYTMVVQHRISKYCPLIAVPEELCIGFKDMEERGKNLPENDLMDEAKAKAFAEATGAGDSDVCQFFFDSLGMIVTDLLSAVHSPLTDKRSLFCQSLRKVRTLLNAPYFGDDVRFGKDDTALADVLLQMIRNYIAGGPLVGRIERDVLQWAVSLCMSHSTPLAMGSTKSIGIVPLVHLLPHGGESCNCVVIARSTRRHAGRHMMNFFKHAFGLDFDMFGDGDVGREPRWVYLVPIRDLEPGEPLLTQVMAPVCDSEKEAEHMWRLSCGTAPPSSLPTSKLMSLQADVVKDIVAKGKAAADEHSASLQ